VQSKTEDVVRLSSGKEKLERELEIYKIRKDELEDEINKVNN
jgi:cell division protein FtsB